MPVHSMTAFARHTMQDAWGNGVWEIKSVNHRYLDISFRVPDIFRQFESAWREILRNTFSRGKVECRLTFMPSDSASADLLLNETLIKQLVKAHKRVTTFFDVVTPIKTFDLLRWPGVVEDTGELDEAVGLGLTEGLKHAAAELQKNRIREGNALQVIMSERLQEINTEVDKASQRVPMFLAAAREKLKEKVADLALKLDQERFEQEILFLVQKTDIQEELDRLNTHVNETQRVLEKGGAVGRRIDFLMQEMNREANTLGSKSIDSELTQAAVSCKVLIEHIREQIQNIE